MTTRSAELLRLVHARPGISRTDAARLLGLGSGAVTELVGRLARAALLAEAPTAPNGTRGRPTTLLVPHPTGPLVLAASITGECWRVEVSELGGGVLAAVGDLHAGTAWPEVRAAVTDAVGRLRLAYAIRLRALAVAAPGAVSPDHRLTAAALGWCGVDLNAFWPGIPPTVVVTGNAVALAARAEGSLGAATAATALLHVRLDDAVRGALVDRGRIVSGAAGGAGEFGHLPFGDPDVACCCGARGCWTTAVDGRALARALGHPEPPDPVSFARRVLAAVDRTAAERAALGAVAAALGRGLAGLVNAFDVDLVTLDGLGAGLLAAAPGELGAAYRGGLMGGRRDRPPPVVPAVLGEDGPIAGAADEAWAALLPRLIGGQREPTTVPVTSPRPISVPAAPVAVPLIVTRSPSAR